MRFPPRHILCVVMVVLSLAGCSSGKKNFTLKGSVLYRGAPLPSGVVRIYMAGDRVAMASIRPDGSFEATDVSPGEAKVTVAEDPTERQRRAMAPSIGNKASVPPAVSQPSPTKTVPIPARYGDVKTSGLVFTLVSSQNLEIKLD